MNTGCEHSDKQRDQRQRDEVAVFAAAGWRTAPNFMVELIETLKRRLTAERGMRVVSSGLLFPYGDWSVGSVSQLRAIRRDLMLPMSQFNRSAGAKRIVKSVTAALAEGPAERLILVGHSAGGAAAVQAAALLSGTCRARGIAVFQIGSPKVKVPAALRERVYYAGAGRPRGKIRDAVCAIGNWGGWERGSGGIPRWNRLLYAPATISAVPIVGGHRDYFRNQAPYLNEDGVSNLEIMLDWLLDALPTCL